MDSDIANSAVRIYNTNCFSWKKKSTLLKMGCYFTGLNRPP